MDWLVDTGVLLRLVDTLAADHADSRRAIKKLRSNGDRLAVSPQNIAEFWNVSTRPATARGGYGRSIRDTERCVEFFERYALVLAESPVVYHEWRDLVGRYGISGVSVYDARIVATMVAAGITHLLTLNARDFKRFLGLTVVAPAEV